MTGPRDPRRRSRGGGRPGSPKISPAEGAVKRVVKRLLWLRALRVVPPLAFSMISEKALVGLQQINAFVRLGPWRLHAPSVWSLHRCFGIGAWWSGSYMDRTHREVAFRVPVARGCVGPVSCDSGPRLGRSGVPAGVPAMAPVTRPWPRCPGCGPVGTLAFDLVALRAPTVVWCPGQRLGGVSACVPAVAPLVSLLASRRGPPVVSQQVTWPWP